MTDKWQPIETAPRDGARVLLYVPNYGGVRIGNYSKVIGIADNEVTHWMPLPEPPKEAGEV